ncbi:MAG: methyltransferase [Flavobacteriaceae bacterium]|nr:methyltransferase [Flavobacteriaceae bacterium]MDG1790480.1 methyltransferase [Flavobacteriaceae bacterium]MDG2447668.1 methyltransferase [Flavobacteriaceae bacterium]
MYENSFPHKRYQITLDFLKKYVAKNEIILDLGVSNPFSEILINEGFNVNNTLGQDLDLDTSIVTNNDFDVITAFQIFEHMVAPFNVLTAIKTNKLIASVPLNLWFSNAYRNKNDQWDRHYHEFEDWQFDWLLKKSGWEIKDHIKFTNPVKKIGLRPILRKFTPRFYLVYAERK